MIHRTRIRAVVKESTICIVLLTVCTLGGGGGTYDLETTGATATAFPPKRGDEVVNAEALAVKRAAAITNFILNICFIWYR